MLLLALLLPLCAHICHGFLDYSDIASRIYQYTSGTGNDLTSYGYDTSGSSTDDELAALGNMLYTIASASALAANGNSLPAINPVNTEPIIYPMPQPAAIPPPVGTTQMDSAARMLGYSSGYGFPQTVSGYEVPKTGYGMQHSYSQAQPSGYGMTYEKPKTKKVFVPIVIKKKKKKKRKTIAVYKGFYVEGGTQIFGKFKKIEDCKKACEITPNCFAADYNPWLKKCYVHTNITACEEMRTHPKLIHFKKIPCDLVETPRGLITLGTQIFGGLEQKGVKSLQDCIKKCATAGSGIAANHVAANLARQICFGIDYDFGTHKCYFHTDDTLCPPLVPTIPTPVQLVQAPSVINILLCPISSVTTI